MTTEHIELLICTITSRLAQQHSPTASRDKHISETPSDRMKRTTRSKRAQSIQKADNHTKKISAEEQDTSASAIACPWIRTPIVYPTAVTFLDYVPPVQSGPSAPCLSDRDKNRLSRYDHRCVGYYTTHNHTGLNPEKRCWSLLLTSSICIIQLKSGVYRIKATSGSDYVRRSEAAN